MGSVHDFKIFKDRGFALSEKIKVLADLGFLGIHKEHENTVIPHKKTKLLVLSEVEVKPLSDGQKAENKKQASKRVPVEHTNRDCKIFKICGTKYRGKHKNYEQTWRLVTAIVNLKKATKNQKYATF